MTRLLLAASLLLPLAALAQPAAPPAAEADAAQLEGWLRSEKALTLVDARTAREYEAGHVPGALCIPAERTADEAARLPADKTVPVVYYCRGPACGLARRAATAAWQLGHKTVIIYAGGMPDWKAKGLPVATGAAPGSLKGAAPSP